MFAIDVSRSKIDIIREMKLLAMILFLPLAALAVTVTPLPPSEYADAEVSTNIPFEVSFDAMSRMNFTVSLDASPADDSETVETDNFGQTVFVTSGHAERNFLLKKRRLDESWNLVNVTRRGIAEIGEVALVEGCKPGFAVEVR